MLRFYSYDGPLIDHMQKKDEGKPSKRRDTSDIEGEGQPEENGEKLPLEKKANDNETPA